MSTLYVSSTDQAIFWTILRYKQVLWQEHGNYDRDCQADRPTKQTGKSRYQKLLKYFLQKVTRKLLIKKNTDTSFVTDNVGERKGNINDTYVNVIIIIKFDKKNLVQMLIKKILDVLQLKVKSMNAIFQNLTKNLNENIVKQLGLNNHKH